jgi:hypothetical protein
MEDHPESQLDALAASYLTADIDAARKDMAVLDADIDKLQAKRRALEWKIRRLMPATADQVITPLPKRLNGATKEPAVKESPADIGFRDQIRNVLRESAKGLRPSDITKKLKEKRIPYTGKTDLNVRVCNDLNKMFRSGNLKRLRGHYSISTESAHAPAP